MVQNLELEKYLVGSYVEGCVLCNLKISRKIWASGSLSDYNAVNSHSRFLLSTRPAPSHWYGKLLTGAKIGVISTKVVFPIPICNEITLS